MEKNKNKKLSDELDKYRNSQLSNHLNDLQRDLTNKNMEIERLKKERIDLINQINDLKMNKTSDLESCKPGEKILCIQFKSTDQIIDLALPCKNTDIFVRLEEQLYEHYPEYKETNNYFTYNGILVKRFKSLIDNKIKNSDKILLNDE